MRFYFTSLMMLVGLLCGVTTAHADRGLTVVSAEAQFAAPVMNYETFQSEVTADANGNFVATWIVTVQNSGDETLEAGSDGYSVVVAKRTGGGWFTPAVYTPIGEPVAISETLEPGSMTTVNVSITLNANDNGSTTNYSILENVSGTAFGVESFAVVMPKTKALQISNAVLKTEMELDPNTISTRYIINTDEDGAFTVEWDVTVKNNGIETIEAGSDGYSLTLYDNNTYAEFATVAIAETLESGQETTVTVSASLDADDFPNEIAFFVRENLTQNVRQLEYVIAKKPAGVEPAVTRALAITAVERQFDAPVTPPSNPFTSEVTADADGNFLATWNVTVENTGTETLVPGSNGYSIVLCTKSGNVLFGYTYTEVGSPVSITKILTPGQSTTVTLSVPLTVEANGEYTSYCVKENVSNTDASADAFAIVMPKVVPEMALEITNAMLISEAVDEPGFHLVKDVETDADGNFIISYDVTVKNAGQQTLTPGTEGYSVTLTDLYRSMEFGTADIEIPLAPGEETTVNITVTLNIEDYPDEITYMVVENLTQTTRQLDNIVAVRGGDEPVETRGLQIVAIEKQYESTLNDNWDYEVQADENGQFVASYTVTLKNTGDVVLAPGSEGYSLELQRQGDIIAQEGFNVTYAWETVGEPVSLMKIIMPGEETTVTVNFLLNASDFDGNSVFYLLENVSGTREYADQFVIVSGSGQATSIRSLMAGETSAPVYNLQGQRVDKPAKGIYVVGGKKYAVK